MIRLASFARAVASSQGSSSRWRTTSGCVYISCNQPKSSSRCGRSVSRAVGNGQSGARPPAAAPSLRPAGGGASTSAGTGVVVPDAQSWRNIA